MVDGVLHVVPIAASTQASFSDPSQPSASNIRSVHKSVGKSGCVVTIHICTHNVKSAVDEKDSLRRVTSFLFTLLHHSNSTVQLTSQWVRYRKPGEPDKPTYAAITT